jgi:Transposase DDE domain group 1
MKYSRHAVRRKMHAVPELKFEHHTLTSFAGLVVFQQFFSTLCLKARLARCFVHHRTGKVFGRATLFLQLVVHLLLGYRELRDSRYYQDDPMVQRLLGLRRLPDVATLSRMLKEADPRSVTNLRELLRDLLFERLERLALTRITLDFDGSVLSTTRHAEGTAVGYNKRKKGARSYYPLFCTVAQTGQVLDFLHRAGNVHDSHGAREFILDCLQEVRERLPGIVIEVRMDSAFFSDEIVMALDGEGIEFTVSVPFERFVELKGKIERWRRWESLSADVSYFEEQWKPQVWQRRFRFLFIRTRTQRQQKGPIQLDLFVPQEYGYDFKVIVTNKTLSARKVVAFHEGRGSQEGLFAELKTHCHMGYVPVRKWLGNQTYLLAGVFAHNLLRELQMLTTAASRHTTEKRTPLWAFEQLHAFRAGLIQRAGRLTRPQGTLTLTISANHTIKTRLLGILEQLHNAA